MDPLGSSTSGAVHVAALPSPTPPVAEPQASPSPSAPLPPAARLADRPAAAPEPPPLPVGIQRESLKPPEPAVMSREQMIALLNAALGGAMALPAQR